MSVHESIRVWAVSALLAGMLLVTTATAQIPAAEEWIDVEVVVNLLDGATADNIDAALAKANEALKQAKIRLVKKATDPNAKADSDSSGGLDRDERDKAREEGQKTLNKTVGAGKGVKIDVGSDVMEGDNASGLAIHRNPVVLVEPHADPNVFGRTIAHELCHVFTLGYDLYDANDSDRMMYGYRGGGTDLDPNEVEEIRKGAKKRGKSYFIVPRPLPGQSIAVPCGIDWSIDAHGAILDGFSDIRVVDPQQSVTDPNDPRNHYADIREVIVFADQPFDPAGAVRIDIQLGPGPQGNYFVDSFFDIFFAVDPNVPFGQVQVHLENWQVREAVWVNERGPTTVPVDTIVHRNDEYVGMGQPPTFHNRSLEITVPIEIVALQLTSVQPILVCVQGNHADGRRGFSAPPIQLADWTEYFPFELERPCPCPGLTFYCSGSPQPGLHSVNIVGCGFTPGRTVELVVDGQPVQQAPIPVAGDFKGQIVMSTEPGKVHSVIAREIEDDVSEGGATWAPGFFTLDSNDSSANPGTGPDCTSEIVVDSMTGEATLIVTCDGIVVAQVPAGTTSPIDWRTETQE